MERINSLNDSIPEIHLRSTKMEVKYCMGRYFGHRLQRSRKSALSVTCRRASWSLRIRDRHRGIRVY